MSIIEVKDLTKKYNDVTAVDHVSFQVEEGTMLGFLGVNGAGKTTVINMLATLGVPESVKRNWEKEIPRSAEI